MSNHEDLEAWKQSIELVDQVLRTLQGFTCRRTLWIGTSDATMCCFHSSQLGGRMQQGLNEGLSEICFHCPRVTC
jgi:hypothetical protein